MKPGLIIMAAGLGTRYKGGIKALIPVGPSGELLFDYGVYDALRSGFGKIVFVLRKEIEEDFKALYMHRLEALCSKYGATVKCVIQSMDDIPFGNVPDGRVKPWGTCHAVLAARGEMDGPFCVMNADDYYGQTAFRLVSDFLKGNNDDSACCMVGYRLLNTLSEFGSVTRGICDTEPDGLVRSIKETRHVVKAGNGASADGVPLNADCTVSMNIWGFSTGMMSLLDEGFRNFLKSLNEPLSDEFLLPVYVNRLLAENSIRVCMLRSPDRWFGMTYSEDRVTTQNAIKELVENGIYPNNVFR